MKFGPSGFVIFAHRSSIFLHHEPTIRDRGGVVVSLLFGSLGQLHLFPRHFLVGNQAEKMRDEVQTRAALIVAAHNIPRCVFRIRGFEHLIPSERIRIPFAARRQVHRAELPLPQWVLNARLKATLLLLVADFQPEFDELDAGCDNVFLDAGADLKKALVLLFGAKAHHVFDASTVIPTAIEDHDLTRRREVLHVALQIDLRPLAVRWRRQGNDAENSRAHALGNGLDRTPFSRRIAALEDDNDAQPFVLHPFLQLAEFDLKFAQFLFVFLAGEFRLLGSRVEVVLHGTTAYSFRYCTLTAYAFSRTAPRKRGSFRSSRSQASRTSGAFCPSRQKNVVSSQYA